MTKTNAMRLLEQNHINYDTTEYEYDENNLSGIHAAEAIGLPPEQVFKTLVTKGDKTGILVFCSRNCTVRSTGVRLCQGGLRRRTRS